MPVDIKRKKKHFFTKGFFKLFAAGALLASGILSIYNSGFGFICKKLIILIEANT